MTQDTHHDHSHTGHAHADAETDKQSSTTDKPYTDIVCGMKVKADPQKTRAYEDENYYFCSAGCMDKFDANPASYALWAYDAGFASNLSMQPALQK